MSFFDFKKIKTAVCVVGVVKYSKQGTFFFFDGQKTRKEKEETTTPPKKEKILVVLRHNVILILLLPQTLLSQREKGWVFVCLSSEFKGLPCK